MYSTVLAFLSGIMTLPFFSVIPSLWYFLASLLLLGFLQFFCRGHFLSAVFKYVLIALLGCLFVLWRSERLLEWQLPAGLETANITVTGVIASLPKITNSSMQFVLKMDSIQSQVLDRPVLIDLSYYHQNNYFYPSPDAKTASTSPTRGEVKSQFLFSSSSPPRGEVKSQSLHEQNALSFIPFKVGDRWQFPVRLKHPHGLLNPGGFDYEKWLFTRGIRATGYITRFENAKLLQSQPWAYPIDHIRQSLEIKVKESLNGQTTAGLITALILGAQEGITQNQWNTMRATGTNHLMAIAGVHIAFVSGFIYILVNFFWRRSTRLLLCFPAPQAAACGALVAALFYSALAGFALPTQRALIMLAVFLLSVFLRRELHVWNALALALGIILLWDPLATLSISFWLSFGAVFAIIYGVTGRLKAKGLWWKYGRVQWVITIGLIPVSLALFQQTSLISLIANAIAVPAVGILVLPLCLTGAIFILIFPILGHWTLWLAAKIIGWIWALLAMLGSLPGAIWYQPMPNVWVLVAALIGILLLIAPKGFPARWVGILWFFPLIFFKSPAPLPGTIAFTLLDVGQGLSAVVQTQHHTLIFDTGPKMGEDDAGNRVIVPFLRAMGISNIDTLMISHGDSDHIGGAFSLLKQIPVKQVVSSVPDRFTSASLCLAGQQWSWDGVIFKVLYPPKELLGQDNNSSCVLRVETANGSLLLTGDIEKPAEEYLTQSVTEKLSPTTILIAPHHGSITSSTLPFVEAVQPKYVLFPVGYKNRFHFPSEIVVERYSQATQFRADETGAIRMIIGGKQGVVWETQRELQKNIWREIK